LLLTSLAHAEEPAKPEPYTLKNRSSFSLPLEGRVPFWPIGWQRPKAGEPVRPTKATAAPVVAPTILLTPESFNVSSVLLGNPSLATINGRSFEEGEYLPVRSGEQRLKVQVRAIREQGVWLQLDNNQPVLIPIRRDEIRAKTAPTPGQAEWSIQLAPAAGPKTAPPQNQ
jgi:hypothetical protein